MAAGALQLLGKIDIVSERILGARRVENIAGVADRALGEFSLLHHRVDGDAHVVDPVQTIEDAEQIHAATRRAPNEEANDIVGIVGIANPVRSTQQHLRQYVRRLFANKREPLPGILVQEAHGDVESRPAPAFQREEFWQSRRIGRSGARDVEGSHPRREQRLVSVAHSRIGDEDPGLHFHPIGEPLRAEPIEDLTRSLRGRPIKARRLRPVSVARRPCPAPGFRMAVDRDIGDVGKQLRRPILAFSDGEKLWSLDR